MKPPDWFKDWFMGQWTDKGWTHRVALAIAWKAYRKGKRDAKKEA